MFRSIDRRGRSEILVVQNGAELPHLRFVEKTACEEFVKVLQKGGTNRLQFLRLGFNGEHKLRIVQ